MSEPEQLRYLPLVPNMSQGDVLHTLRVNALVAYQKSVGRGDDLVETLKRTTQQLEKTHSRIQNMSTILFITGLVVLAAGVFQLLWGREGQEAWGALLSGLGGVSTIAATFWTAPLRRISDSVTDMVKLETAFLGYIRVVGEADSAFQMQYLDKLSTGQGSSQGLGLDKVCNETTRQVKEAMAHTLDEIDDHVFQKEKVKEVISAQVTSMENRLKAVEEVVSRSKQQNQAK